MKKGIITTSLWDPSKHLETDEDRVLYLEAALEDGDPALIAAVLGDIARAKGNSKIWMTELRQDPQFIQAEKDLRFNIRLANAVLYARMVKGWS